jgi:XTP/dITP diphosphohydrolase
VDDGLQEPMTTLFIATRNLHKIREIQAILGPRVHYLTLCEFPSAPAVVEDAPTFAGNATKKAQTLAEWLAETRNAERGRWNEDTLVLADDSGLEVDALDLAPGVHSARFAALDQAADGSAGNSPDADNNEKLLRLLKDVPAEQRSARFRCVIALARVGNPPPGVSGLELFEGVCEGRIGFEPRGQNGFGYDPLFMPAGFNESFAELGDAVKNSLSHRARALQQLQQSLAIAR